MDHISKALERARSEQKSIQSWIQPGTHREPAASPDRIIPVLKVAPEVLRDRHVLCDAATDNPMVADRYRLLRTRVMQLMRGRHWLAAGVTSPGAREGKTLTALNLAISIARDGRDSVILVDADLRNPSIAERLGIEPKYGLIDYLAGEVSLEDVIVRLDIENLLLIPGREPTSRGKLPELLHSDRLATLAKSIRESGQMLLMDLPPVLVGDDVLATAPAVDALLLVIDEGHTELEELKRTAELLGDIPLLGTVLNRSNEQAGATTGYSYYTTSVDN